MIIRSFCQNAAVASLVLGLAGCATVPPTIARVVVSNQTAMELRDVKIVHMPTLRQSEMPRVPPSVDVVVDIPASSLRAKEAVMSWTDGEGPHRLAFELPPAPRSDVPLTLFYIVKPHGAASVSIR